MKWNYFLFLPKRGRDWVFCRVGNPWVPHVVGVPGGHPQGRHDFQVGHGLHEVVLVQLQAQVGLRRGPRGRQGHPQQHRVGLVVDSVHRGRRQPRRPVLCPQVCRQRGRI